MKKHWSKLNVMKEKQIIHKKTNDPMKCALCGKIGLIDFFGLPHPEKGEVKLCRNCFEYISRQVEFNHNNR